MCIVFYLNTAEHISDDGCIKLKVSDTWTLVVAQKGANINKPVHLLHLCALIRNLHYGVILSLSHY